MGAEVVDAVGVVDGAVRLHGIHSAQTVLHDEQRLLVAIVEGVHGDAEAHRVDGPAPLARLEVGVLSGCADGVAVGLFHQLLVHRDAAAGIVAEGDEVHGALPQGLVIFRLGAQRDAGPLHPLLGPDGVGPAGLDVDEEVVVAVGLGSGLNVLRCAGAGVEFARSQHTAHHTTGHDLMGQLDGLGAGHQLVVSGLILGLLHILARLEEQTGPHEGHVEQHIDLVEGQPVFDLALVAVEEDVAVVDVGVHHPAVFPAAVLFNKGNGCIEVADGHQRFDAVLVALVEEGIVEGEALLVGFSVVAVRQDAGPRDRQPVAPEAHLGEESDVLLEMVIHVDGFVGGVVVLRVAVQHLQLAEHHREAVLSEGDHVHIGRPAAALVVCALALVGGGGTAPQKVFRKSAHGKLPPVHNVVTLILPCSAGPFKDESMTISVILTKIRAKFLQFSR